VVLESFDFGESDEVSSFLMGLSTVVVVLVSAVEVEIEVEEVISEVEVVLTTDASATELLLDIYGIVQAVNKQRSGNATNKIILFFIISSL